MRKRNWRVVIVGMVLAALVLGFFFFMVSIASQSTDPGTLLQTVGAVTGVVLVISMIMIVSGLIGKKA
ncbi:MAG: hypothetical protein U0Z26_16525 [Anaerolineales bacterium]